MFLTVCEKLQFPAEAVGVLQAALDTILADPAAAAALSEAGDRFTTIGSADPAELLAPIAEKTGIPLATVTMVCLVQAVPKLLALSRDKGVDEAILWDTLIDLRCKLIENHDVEGIWGTAAIVWYQRVFTLRILKLGRLEYEPMYYRWDTPYGNVYKDQPVLNIHIPSCGSLPFDEVLDSLKQAYTFFGTKDGAPMPFICASWMLYPPMCEQVFPEGSNLDRFYRCFQTVEQYADPDNKHFWRIFGIYYSPEALEQAPADTTLRRNLLTWMLRGNDMGIGRSAFLFDGNQIIHV